METKDLSIQNVAVIGMGALGIMFGDMIARALPSGSVTVVADAARVTRYRASRVTANDHLCDFLYATPEEFLARNGGCTADLILFGVKAAGLKDAIELARPLADEHTILVSLLNGISSEEYIAEGLGRGHVIYCVAQQMAAGRVGTAVHYRNKGVLCLGVPDSHPQDQSALQKLLAFFEACDVPYVAEPDILRRLWCKWMFNVGINQTVMVYEGKFADAQKPGPLRDEFLAAMREVVALAQKSGIDVSEKDVEEYVQILDQLDPEGMPSMRQDGLAKRFSEVDMFAGEVCRRGRKLGVPTPVNASLLERVKAVESTYKTQRKQIVAR